MTYRLRFADEAKAALEHLESRGNETAAKLKKVRKALGHLQRDPRHRGLHTHQYENFPGRPDDKVWDSYVENHTPSAWRLYWMYGPDEENESGSVVSVITVLVIGPHL